MFSWQRNLRSQDPSKLKIPFFVSFAVLLKRTNEWIYVFQITTYYGDNPKIRYVIEQSDVPGMLKLVGKRSLQVSEGHKTDWRCGTKQVFRWACGRCFFERQKKSSIKAHIIQRVCQRPINEKAPKRKSTSRHLSQSESQEDTLEGYWWESHHSV